MCRQNRATKYRLGISAAQSRAKIKLTSQKCSYKVEKCEQAPTKAEITYETLGAQKLAKR
jgi:hypothetical protein